MANTTLYHDDFTKNIIKEIPTGGVDLFLLDPPYELGYENGKDYDDSKGIVDWDILVKECWRTLKDTGNLIIFTGWSNVSEVKDIFLQEGKWILNNRIIWDRQKYHGCNNNLPSAAEDILWFSKTKDRTFHKIESNIKKVTSGFGKKNGRENRILSNVWSDIPPIFPGSPEHIIGGKYKGQKPVALIERILKVFSNEGDIVWDGYCGSGTTGEACENLNRIAYLCDKSPRAIEISKNRLKLYNEAV